jgi:uncharacterized protein DUF6544
MVFAGLPAPVRKWAEAADLASLQRVETIRSAGHGRVRLGPLPWLPMDHSSVHVLGRDEVRDICLRVGPVAILRVLDAYVEGTGLTKIGPVPQLGAEVDQGAWLAMWAEAIFWPRAWVIGGLQWEAIDETHARARLPFGQVDERLDLTFDPATHFPNIYEVLRCKGAGRKVRWRADFSDLRRFGRVWAWSHVLATWTDEPGPWYEAWIDDVETNVSVSDPAQRARAAVARALRRH